MSDVGGSVLGQRFWRILSAAGLSNLADGVLKTAVPLIAILVTRDPLLIGGVGVAYSLPWLLFALPAGAVADRSDRKLVMIASNIARALVCALLAATLWGGISSIWVIYAAAILSGIAEVFYDTTSQSILPQLVERPQLPRANSRLMAVEMVMNQFAGPPLGGLLVGLGIAGAAAIAVGTPAGLWLVAVAILWGVAGNFTPQRSVVEPDAPVSPPHSDHTPQPPLSEHAPLQITLPSVEATQDRAATTEGKPAATSLWADVADGMKYLVKHRVLRTLALMTGAGNFGMSMHGAVFVLFAVGTGSSMGMTEAQFGLFGIVLAAGSLTGSLIAAWAAKRMGRSAAIAFGVITFTLYAAAPAFSASWWVIGAVSFLSGVGVMVWNVIAVSLRQQITPDHLLGRVNSSYRLMAWGVMPVAALLGGAIGSKWGLTPVFVIAGLINLVSIIGMAVVTNTNIEAAESAVVSPQT
jgi:MFS family permease